MRTILHLLSAIVTMTAMCMAVSPVIASPALTVPKYPECLFSTTQGSEKLLHFVDVELADGQHIAAAVLRPSQVQMPPARDFLLQVPVLLAVDSCMYRLGADILAIEVVDLQVILHFSENRQVTAPLSAVRFSRPMRLLELVDARFSTRLDALIDLAVFQRITFLSNVGREQDLARLRAFAQGEFEAARDWEFHQAHDSQRKAAAQRARAAQKRDLSEQIDHE